MDAHSACAWCMATGRLGDYGGMRDALYVFARARYWVSCSDNCASALCMDWNDCAIGLRFGADWDDSLDVGLRLALDGDGAVRTGWNWTIVVVRF